MLSAFFYGLSKVTEMARDFLLESCNIATALKNHTYSLFLKSVHTLDLLLITKITIINRGANQTTHELTQSVTLSIGI